MGLGPAAQCRVWLRNTGSVLELHRCRKEPRAGCRHEPVAAHAAAWCHRQSAVLWSALDARPSSAGAAEALAAWVHARRHQLLHLRLVPGGELQRSEGRLPPLVRALLAAAPQLVSLELHSERSTADWVAAAGRLTCLVLKARWSSCYSWPGIQLSPELGQLTALRTLRLDAPNAPHESRVLLCMPGGCIPAGLQHFAAARLAVPDLQPLAAAASSLRRLDLRSCQLGTRASIIASASDSVAPALDGLGLLLQRATGLTHLALDGVPPEAWTAMQLRVLKLEYYLKEEEETGGEHGGPAAAPSSALASLTALFIGREVELAVVASTAPVARLRWLRVHRGPFWKKGAWPSCLPALRHLETLVVPMNELFDLAGDEGPYRPWPAAPIPSLRRLVLVRGTYLLGPGQLDATAQQLAAGCGSLSSVPRLFPALSEVLFHTDVYCPILSFADYQLDALRAAMPHLRIASFSCPDAWELAAGAAPCPCCL